jgi:hypothetical protein
MKLSYVKEHFKNNRRIAEALNITPQAVGLWSVEKIPELRAYQLADLIQKQEVHTAKLKLALKMIEAGSV